MEKYMKWRQLFVHIIEDVFHSNKRPLKYTLLDHIILSFMGQCGCVSHAVILQSCCSLWPNVSNIKLYNIYRPDCLKERHIQETRKACGKYVLSCGNIFPTNALSPFVIQIRKHSNIKLIYFYVNILHRLFCTLCIGMFIMLFSMIT